MLSCWIQCPGFSSTTQFATTPANNWHYFCTYIAFVYYDVIADTSYTSFKCNEVIGYFLKINLWWRTSKSRWWSSVWGWISLSWYDLPKARWVSIQYAFLIHFYRILKKQVGKEQWERFGRMESISTPIDWDVSHPVARATSFDWKPTFIDLSWSI